jgi:hypothetical protein
MPEAEVSLRLAEYLTEQPGFGGHVDVAIDGASVAVHGAEVFNIAGYLSAFGWELIERNAGSRNEWAATYRRREATMRVHSQPGIGDVAATIYGMRVIAECKKGPLVKKLGSQENPRLTSAIGQALLLDAEPDDLLVAAVPSTDAFRRLAVQWRERPRLRAAGIQIALVGRDGTVDGLSLPFDP